MANRIKDCSFHYVLVEAVHGSRAVGVCGWCGREDTFAVYVLRAGREHAEGSALGEVVFGVVGGAFNAGESAAAAVSGEFEDLDEFCLCEEWRECDDGEEGELKNVGTADRADRRREDRAISGICFWKGRKLDSKARAGLRVLSANPLPQILATEA